MKRLVRIRVLINFDGKQPRVDFNFPLDIPKIKQEITRRSSIPVKVQNLFEQPESPNQVPGLRLCADKHNFANAMNVKVSFVLTSGNMPFWTYFCVKYPRGGGNERSQSSIVTDSTRSPTSKAEFPLCAGCKN